MPEPVTAAEFGRRVASVLTPLIREWWGTMDRRAEWSILVWQSLPWYKRLWEWVKP